MRVIIIQEGICAAGESWHQRLRDLVTEAVAADRAGFDVYALSEQHFAQGEAIVTAPEIILPAVAARTENIRLRIASVNLLPYNHPIRVAEQIAMLDVISGGRAELGGARSNNPYTLDGFGIPADQTRMMRGEHLNIIGQAFQRGSVAYESDLYSIPERRIAPIDPALRSLPVHLSASGVDSHREAGEIGVGSMTGLTIVGYEYAEACLNGYKDGISRAKPLMGTLINRSALLSVGVCCDANRQHARDLTRQNTLRFVEVILDFFLKLADKSPDYRYFHRLSEIVERKTDLDYLIESTPYVTAGTPEDLIASARALYDLGYDDVIWRIDGLGHANNLASIELIGKEVLPEIHSWPEHPGSTPASAWQKLA